MSVETVPHSSAHLSALLSFAGARSSDFLADLEHLVGIDSGSRDVGGLVEVARWARRRLLGMGFDVELVPVSDREGAPLGPVVVARRPGRGRRVLLLAHMDTVFPKGTAAARPLRVDGSRALGPGVCDDKGGLLAGLHAVEALDAVALGDSAQITVVLTPDEEIGSPGSRALLEQVAAEADVALCLEGARENGDLVGARKGVADLHLRLTGRAAHAGVEPDRGASAAVEAARLTLELSALDGSRPGLTSNVGVIRSGTRPNVVASEALVVAEVRASTMDDLQHAIDHVRERVDDPSRGVRVELDVREVTAPLEPTPASADLAVHAASVAAELGLSVRAAATGGVSDANLIAATGCPTLDGLGPVGGDDHGESEWLDLRSAPERIALLAGLIVRVAGTVPAGDPGPGTRP